MPKPLARKTMISRLVGLLTRLEQNDCSTPGEDRALEQAIELLRVAKPLPPEDPDDQKFRDAAKRLFHKEGEIEIDAGAPVSGSNDGGCYVQAWVWVGNSEAGIHTDDCGLTGKPGMVTNCKMDCACWCHQEA